MKTTILSLFLAASAFAATYRVGPTEAIKTPCAVTGLADGDIIEIAAGTYTDVSCGFTASVTLRGISTHRPVFNWASGGAKRLALGKGIFVLSGASKVLTVEGLEITGAVAVENGVAQLNGAAIRIDDGGSLVVRNCHIHDNENGILTAGGAGSLNVEGSRFERNGTNGYSHHVYAGTLVSVTVRASAFVNPKLGHSIKSRALKTDVVGNLIYDDGTIPESYAVETGNGGAVLIENNLIKQGVNAQSNYTLISAGTDATIHAGSALTVRNNVMLNERADGGVFIASRIPCVASANKLLGPGGIGTCTDAGGNTIGPYDSTIPLVIPGEAPAPVAAWSVVSGSLPPGLTLSPAGLISGVPAQSGTFAFTVRVVVGTQSAEKAMTLTVDAGAVIAILVTSPAVLPAATIGTAYAYQLEFA